MLQTFDLFFWANAQKNKSKALLIIINNKEDGPLSLEELNNFIVDVSSGLAEALKEGIIHNDIKDPNIFVFNLGGKKVYKITDFGGCIILKKKKDSDLP